MDIKPNIVPVEKYTYARRAELFKFVYNVLKSLERFTARTKFTKALADVGIRVHYGDRNIYFSRGHDSLEIYIGWAPSTTIAQLRAAFDDRERQYNWEDDGPDDVYEAGLYKTQREIEQYLGEELTPNQFAAKKRGIAKMLREFAAEVEALNG